MEEGFTYYLDQPSNSLQFNWIVLLGSCHTTNTTVPRDPLYIKADSNSDPFTCHVIYSPHGEVRKIIIVVKMEGICSWLKMHNSGEAPEEKF